MQVVWFSEIKWDYLRTRKQQIISRKPADVQLLYLEPYVKGRRNRFRLRTEGDIFCATVPFIKSAPYFPWRTVLDRRLARRMVDLTAHLRIRRLLQHIRFDTDRVVFVVSNIYAVDIALRLPRRFLLYDCNDAHASFPGMRSWTEAYFYKTCRSADAVYASSNSLLGRVVQVRGNSNNCAYVGNGVEYSHFQDAESGSRESGVPAKTRLGYIGAIAPWVDFDVIAEIAKTHPEWEVVLVGPALHGVARDLERVTALPNVFRFASVPYDRVPGILRQLTVGLIPFRYNELTEGVNPNKLYEYLASGLPVVSTRFSEEVQAHPSVVKSVDPGRGFVEACEQMVSAVASEDRGRRIAEEARKIASKNDWEVIAERFWSRLRKLVTER